MFLSILLKESAQWELSEASQHVGSDRYLATSEHSSEFAAHLLWEHQVGKRAPTKFWISSLSSTLNSPWNASWKAGTMQKRENHIARTEQQRWFMEWFSFFYLVLLGQAKNVLKFKKWILDVNLIEVKRSKAKFFPLAFLIKLAIVPLHELLL